MNQEPTNQQIFDMLLSMTGSMATKDDIKNMATKDDIKKLRNETQQDFATQRAEFKKDIQQLRDDTNKHVDDFIGLYKNQESENSALSSRQTRTENTVNNIITTLEIPELIS